MDGLRTCRTCGEGKASSEFTRNAKTRDGLDLHCKTCKNAKQMERYTLDQRRTHALKSQYNMSRATYDAMYAEQEGKCFICRKHEEWLCVDHDKRCCPDRKSCGECIRKLLCRNCNSAIGLAGDDTEVLLAMVNYVEVFSV